MTADDFSAREMVSRLLLCHQAVEYYGYERLAALADGDHKREQAAHREQTVMLGHVRAWQERLRVGRSRPLTVVMD